jgi:sugar lactone lactonase YvrE
VLLVGRSGGTLWSTTGTTLLSTSQITSFSPSGLRIDSNNTLYIVDEITNAVVWKLLYGATTATNLAGVSQSAGSSSTQFNYPQGVYTDANANTYVTDYYNYRVQKFASGSSTGTTIAGITGSAGTALNLFNGLRYFTFDATESFMYVTDYNNHRVMRYSTSSTSGTNGVLAAGTTGSAGNSNTTLYNPWSVYTLSNITTDLFISNYNGHSIMRWTPTASSGYFVAGVPGTSGQSPVLLSYPTDVKIDSYVNLYVVDYNNHRVQLFCANSQTAVTIAGTGVSGSTSTQLYNPKGMAFDSYMNLYVSDQGNGRIQKFLKI